MRSVVAVVALVCPLVVCGSSCTDNKQPPPDRHTSILSPPVSAKLPTGEPAKVTSPNSANRRAVAPAPQVAQSDAKPTRTDRQAERHAERQQASNKSVVPQVPAGAPAPPKGAQYTIFCGRVEGDAHVERAVRVKNELNARTGLNGFYVIHEAGQSLLYYGFYRTFNDPKDRKETSRAQADLKRIKMLESDGNRVFSGALFVDLEAPDPQAPPEWNLVNAGGAWSLQIAAYKDSPLRKEAAVEAVREARKQGIEAYYYHGDTVSSVCVGVWPEQAIRYNSPTKGQLVHDPVIVNQPVIADPSQSVPMSADEIRPAAKKANAEVVQGKVDVVDPSLLQAMRQYPFHAVNGMQTARTVNGKQEYDPSLLIRVPQPDAAPAVANAPQDGYAPTAGASQASPLFQQQLAPLTDPERERRPAEQRPPAKQPPPAPQPGLGKLKSIDG